MSFKKVIFTGGGKIGNWRTNMGAGAPFYMLKKPETEPTPVNV
jgi:hypothetical protein